MPRPADAIRQIPSWYKAQPAQTHFRLVRNASRQQATYSPIYAGELTHARLATDTEALMARYTRAAKPRAFDLDDDEPLRPDIQVDEFVDVETSLLWPDGEPIMRTPNPIGFGRDKEW